MTEQPCTCQHCGHPKALRYHQRTQYVEEARNWVTLCKPCQRENDAYWDEMWSSYYASVL